MFATSPKLGRLKSKSKFLQYIGLIFFFFATTSTAWAQFNINNLTIENGLPTKTKITKLGDEIYLNGVPTLMIGIAVPMSIKETSKFFGDRWSAEGWVVNLERSGDLILVMATDGKYQKVASLAKTGANSTEGSISLTDMPLRLTTGEGHQLPVGEHLIKPINSMVLNEVRIRDAAGESIMTTLTNKFDVEQNAAFYQERMVEDGWKLKRRKTVEENKSLILVFEKPGKESTFTFVRQKRQSFVTVNWINR